MHTLKVNEKEYEILPTYGKFMKLYKKYDFTKVEELTLAELQDLAVSSYWLFLKRKWYGLKPFVFKSVFANNIMIQQVMEMAQQLPKFINGEDRNLGNSE